MASDRPTVRQLTAPASLGLDTRTSFRQAAVRALEEMPEGRADSSST